VEVMALEDILEVALEEVIELSKIIQS